MTTRTTIVRGLLGLGASTALALGAAAGLASVAEAGTPASVTVTAAPTSGGAQVTAVVPLAVKDIGSASCALDGSPVGCGTPVAAGKSSTRYTPSVSGLTGGNHTFTIKVSKASKNDRKATTTLTGSTTFLVLPDESALCESVGATYTADGFGWDCDIIFPQDLLYSDVELNYVTTMGDACVNDGATNYGIGPSSPADPDPNLVYISITCQP